MPKEHPEFKELFGWVQRGAAFAIVRTHPIPFILFYLHFLISLLRVTDYILLSQRRKIKNVKINEDEAERLVNAHVKMYFDGFGGAVG